MIFSMNKLYTLSIRLVPEAFSYLIYNPDNKETAIINRLSPTLYNR